MDEPFSRRFDVDASPRRPARFDRKLAGIVAWARYLGLQERKLLFPASAAPDPVRKKDLYVRICIDSGRDEQAHISG